MSNTTDIVERLRLCAYDPMWAHHAEVPKKWCREAVEEIERLRAALAQPAASGEPAMQAIRCWCCGSPNWPTGSVGVEHAGAVQPFAWFCQWFNADGSPEWDQYHDRTDPMPADDEWEDRPPDRVTPLYATPHPAPARVPPEDWSVFNDSACVADGLTYAEALDYLTPERLQRGWSAVCVANRDNIVAAAPDAQKGEP